MPTESFESKWSKRDSVQANIERLSNDFKMASSLAIATKALLLQLIDYRQYEDFKNGQMEYFLNKKSSSKGGSYYSNVLASNSKNFARSVIVDTLNGYETYREALNLLDIRKFDSLDKVANQLGIL